MKIDWKLKGFNLARFTCNKNAVLHPETCSDMVLMNHDDTSPLSLKNWITNNGNQQLYSSLGAWLTNYLGDIAIDVNANYTSLISGSSVDIGYIGGDSAANIVKVPIGSTTDKGVLSVGTGLNVESGKISVGTATSTTDGGIKIGFTSHDNLKAVELSQYGQAFVDIGSVSSNLWYWSGTGTPVISNSVIASIYHEPTTMYTSSQLSTRFSEMYSYRNSLANIYPVCADLYGLLYTIVPPPTIPTYSFQSGTNGFIVNSNGVVTSVEVTPFIENNITGRTDTVNSIAKFDGALHVTRGPVFGNNTSTYLRNDGTWHTPTNTQYGSDEDTILMNENNKFSDPHQHTAITVVEGDLAVNGGSIDSKEIFAETDGVLSFNKFKKTNCVIVNDVLQITNSRVENDILWILSCFGKSNSALNSGGTFTYRGVLVKDGNGFTITVADDSAFYTKIAGGHLILTVYGDVSVDDTTGLVFTLDVSDAAQVFDITFDYTSDGHEKEFLNIIFDRKEFSYSSANIS